MNFKSPTLNAYKLRKFREEDLYKVVSINRLCLPENYTSSFFLELYKSYPETFLVAEFGDDVIGYVTCRVEFGFSELHRFKVARKGHVVSIAVLQEHRLRGLGTALMLAALRGMTHYDCAETFLEVRAGNTNAINLYNKLGYKVTRTVSSYYFDGEDAAMMSRKLPLKPEEMDLFRKSSSTVEQK